MIKEKYKPYPKYKASGIEWIGEIPEGWEERRFCFLFSFTKGLSITKEDLMDEGIPCVNYGEIHSKYGFEVDPKKHDLKCVKTDYLKSNPNSILKHGDFVFADTSEDIEGSGNFTYLNSKEITFAGYHTIITKPKNDFDFRYTAFLFDSVPFRTQIRSEVSGIKVYSITKTILKDTIVLLPPIPEQRIIADFLDHETAKIDGVVAKQTQMIELLKEKRVALITQAVTKGLNPKAKMKLSGIEWIGEIPEGWEERRFCFLFSFTKGLSITKEDLMDEGIPCVNYGEIHSKYGFEVDPKKHDLKCVKTDYLKSNPNSILKHGDFVFADTSEDIEGSGNFTYLNSKEITFAGYHTIITKPKNDFDFRYTAFLFDSVPFRTQIRSEVSGIKVYSITKTILKDTIVLLPPIPEQRIIADFLDHETAKIDAMIDKIENQIVLLNEYKQSLITHAVTGEIDVRGEMNAQNN